MYVSGGESILYSENEREELFLEIASFLDVCEEFEGLLQIGSGAKGYKDIYSDIDLMAGCFDEGGLLSAKEKLVDFFKKLGAIYIDERAWSKTALGLSVYFENGLSVDISFMPTAELAIRSGKWKTVFAKTEKFIETAEKSAAKLKERKLGDSIHHPFIYALRRCEAAVLRGEFIYAEKALSEGRELLLFAQAAKEGREIHQFKAFNTLDGRFIEKLEDTYPKALAKDELTKAKEALLDLYLETVEGFLNFDKTQLKLIGCFE